MFLAQALLSFQNRLTTDAIIATNSGGTTEALGVEYQTEIKACSNTHEALVARHRGGHPLTWDIKYHCSTWLK